MLTTEEEKFLAYWKENRNKEKSFLRQYSLGLSIGMILGIAILLNFVSGWYTRATMVANSQSTPLVLIVAVILIAVFFSVFYKRHKREMNDQRYMELMIKKEKSSGQMQQEEELDSQVSK